MRSSSRLLAVVIVLAAATPALANSIAPTFYFLPGILPLMLGVALPASVLAAVLERPFFLRAGVRESTLWYSLQANAVSLAVGFVTLPVGVLAIYSIGPLWSVAAVAMSVASEGWYLKSRALPKGEPLQWGWVVAGNVFSSVVLLVLPPIALAIKEGQPELAADAEAVRGLLFWASVAASGVLFAVSFLVPTLRRRRAAGVVVSAALHIPATTATDTPN